MKKFLFVFFIILILTVMVIPSYAAIDSDFNGYTNLIISNSSNYTSGDFIKSDGSVVSDVPVWKLNLKPSTTYTFVSSGGGTDRLLVAPTVMDSSGDRYFYESESTNLLYLGNSVTTINGVTFTQSSDGTITMNGTSTGSTVYYLTGYYIPPGSYTYKVFGTRNLNGSNFYSTYSNENTGRSGGDYGSGSSFTSNGNTYTFAFTIGSGQTLNNVVVRPGVYSSAPTEPSIGYSESFYIDQDVSLVSFTTPSKLSGQYVLALHDPTASGISDVEFSRITSDSNYFYLIEGSFTYNDVKSIFDENLADSVYASGYDSGYSVGQTDGLNSSNTFPRLIYTVLSAPFVIISNTLNFEIMGLNVLNLVKVVLTILIIAFVFTKLKGRE